MHVEETFLVFYYYLLWSYLAQNVKLFMSLFKLLNDLQNTHI